MREWNSYQKASFMAIMFLIVFIVCTWFFDKFAEGFGYKTEFRLLSHEHIETMRLYNNTLRVLGSYEFFDEEVK